MEADIIESMGASPRQVVFLRLADSDPAFVSFPGTFLYSGLLCKVIIAVVCILVLAMVSRFHRHRRRRPYLTQALGDISTKDLTRETCENPEQEFISPTSSRSSKSRATVFAKVAARSSFSLSAPAEEEASAEGSSFPCQVVQEAHIWPFEISANQVFDVQWNYDGRTLSATNFKQPAGTDAQGGFMRPQVDRSNDYYELDMAKDRASHFALAQYAAGGTLKNQLTTFGQIKAISTDVILYSGDGQFGTLITLTKHYNYGDRAEFSGLRMNPSQTAIDRTIVMHKAFEAGEDVPDVSLAPCSRLLRRGSSLVMEGGSLCAPLKQLGRSASKTAVSFEPRVTVVYLPDIKMLVPAWRDILWWRKPEDFKLFLQNRLILAKSYKKVAKQLGVPTMKVCSVGSYGNEAYKQMIEAMPELRDESRRGLSLGRVKRISKHREMYVKAVIDEQERQQEAGVVQLEAYRQVVRSVTAKDLDYAQKLAATHYEQDKLHADSIPSNPLQTVPSMGTLFPLHEDDTPATPPASPELAPGFDPCAPEPEIGSVWLNDEAEAEDDSMITTSSASRSASKGFGLSRETLQEAGLSMTGHALSKKERLRTSSPDGSPIGSPIMKAQESMFSDDGGESEVSLGDTSGGEDGLD